MFRFCPTCSYIAKDGEAVCPFCNADFASGRNLGSEAQLRSSDFALFGQRESDSGDPETGSLSGLSYWAQQALRHVPYFSHSPQMNLRNDHVLRLNFLAPLLFVAFLLSACSVEPNAPIAAGSAADGTLASSNMSDYYYPRAAGYTYVYKNTLTTTPAGGSPVSVVGDYDTLKTLGYRGIAGPNGDSLFAFSITYRLLEQYAGRGDMDVPYITNGTSSNGAFIDGSTSGIDNVQYVTAPKPKPVSTDTILAGLHGRIKQIIDPFDNTGSRIWQTDTLWFTAHLDSVIIWERNPQNNNVLMASRQLFYKNFKQGNQWQYGLWENSTYFKVNDEDVSVTVTAGTWRCVKIAVITPSINAPITEHKFFGCGAGLVKQHDHWYTTSTGSLDDKAEQSLCHSLESISH